MSARDTLRGESPQGPTELPRGRNPGRPRPGLDVQKAQRRPLPAGTFFTTGTFYTPGSGRVGSEVAAQVLQTVVVGGKAPRLQGERPAHPLGQPLPERLLVAPQREPLGVLPIEQDRQIAAPQGEGLQRHPAPQQLPGRCPGQRGAATQHQNKGLQLISVSPPLLAALGEELTQLWAGGGLAPGPARPFTVTAGPDEAVQEANGSMRHAHPRRWNPSARAFA